MSARNHKPDPGRRAILRGRRPERVAAPLRPPWTDDARMAEACTRCGACLTACPESILTIGAGGMPEVDFGRGGGECTFCGACAEACPEPVFDTARRPAWNLVVEIDTGACLPHRGVHCEACRDICPEGAIRFAPRLGAPPAPAIDAEACTACGACRGVCPAGAVRITAPDTREAA